MSVDSAKTASAELAVFVDFDGTITDLDTFDVLVRSIAGDAPWARLEAELAAGRLTLRDALAAEARLLGGISLAEADALLARATRVDPAFPAGVAPLIRLALARCGLDDLPVHANEVEVVPDGWRLCFRDASANGHDKARAVRRAAAAGDVTVFIGDGRSDFEAALVADRRFARRGRALEAYLRDVHVPYAAFDDFTEVARALFGPGARPTAG